MLRTLKLVFLACATMATMASHAHAQTAPSVRDFSFLIGEWRGDAAFLRPFQPDAGPLRETVEAECRYILRETYVQCHTRWTRPDTGRIREVVMLWNFNEQSGQLEALFLASNYGAESGYAVHWDERERAFVGLTSTQTPDGAPAQERSLYIPGADGATFEGREFVMPANAAEWVQTFRFHWRRVQ
ncbi:MAG: hypothetical protein AB7P07_00635 [Hyphomonadaceae bacterium]